MTDFLKDCVEEVFTKENLNTLWQNRQSNSDYEHSKVNRLNNF